KRCRASLATAIQKERSALMPQAETKAWRNDAYAKVTGKAKFTDDLKFPGVLHAAPVYSDFVHARIKAIDTEIAEAVRGVIRVLTAKDVPGVNHFGQIIRDFRIFADDKIRYHGDVVAIVVAETREIAMRAAQLVRVDAAPLPAVLDPEEALKPGAVLVHESHGSNLINTHVVRRGNVEEGFKQADFVIEQDFSTQFIEHAYLETEAAVCVPRPTDGVIEVYGSMQHPFSTRRFVAACLGVALSEVEIIGTPMGGGFGGKDDTAAIVCARTALAAKLLGRPVKMVYRRDWSMRESYKRHPYRVHYQMGVNRAGRITAVQCRIVADGGAYCSVTPWVTWRSTVQCCGPYVVENVHCDTFGVYTNNVVTGAMRGFGSPQMNFVIEQVVEMAAEKVGISGIEFRRRNMVRQGSVTITGQKLDGHKVAIEQVLDTVLREIDYEKKLAKCARGNGGDELYGIGLAMSYRGVSLGAEGVDFCAAIINAQVDGSILLEVGVHENGQGAESAMSLICAGELGVDLSRIRYRRSSTSNIPDSGTTVASRATIMGGGAVALASRELKKKIAEAFCAKLHCPADEIRFKDNFILGKSDADRIAFADAMREMWLMQKFPFAFGVFKAPRVTWDEHTGQGDAYFTWVYGCQAVELTVNKKTGKVKLLNAVAAHDVGHAVNPEMVRGQIYGGMAMSAGFGLHEEVKAPDGRMTTLNLNTYRIPRSMDMPEMKAIIVENPDPVSPTGAKSIGEPANEIFAPAIANAIYHATGQRHCSSPIRLGAQPEPTACEEGCAK
ncbi:MAG TPA: xanthine dehydrogenase family protein molybdopterin-binding subunit, partial [Candidatus Acidoferrum sp.]|nr:xanthine dehydrogenase family protein molybdopterin-binding subunit [Candidatus Acidoferrum sp.]